MTSWSSPAIEHALTTAEGALATAMAAEAASEGMFSAEAGEARVVALGGGAKRMGQMACNRDGS